MRNSSIFKLAVPSLLLLLGSCELGEPVREPQERSFAPRILEAPQSNQIRLEVAQFTLDGWSGTAPNGAFLRTTTVPYSSGRIKMDGLPSDRTLYFRVSGLDIQGAAIWTIPGGVPNEGSSPIVSIGVGSSYLPRTIAMPNIGWTTDQLFPRIECWNSSWPAWTTDGSLPGPQNPSTASSKNLATTSVQLSPGQKLTARCTDGPLWSPPAFYDAPNQSWVPTGPGTSLPPLQLSIYAASGSDNIYAGVNQAGYSYSNWKLVYRFGTTGDWSVSDFVGIPFSGSGIFQAYAIASNNMVDWVAGPVTETAYPEATAIGPGTFFPAPEIELPWGTSGYAGIDFDASTHSGYSSWRVAVQNSSESPWRVYPVPHEEWLSGTGTLSAYMMAWDGTRWVAGEMASKPYPMDKPAPTADGPSNDLDMVAIHAPALLGDPITFSNPFPSSEFESWKVAFKTSDMTDWKIGSLDTSLVPSSSGTIQAYLVAWSPSRFQWVYGYLAMSEYPVTIPAPTLLAAGGPLPSVDITAPTELPGKATFRPSYSTTGYSNWMVACRRGDMTEYRIIPIDSSLAIASNTTVYAYLLAWNPTTKAWQSGPQNMVAVTSGQSILTPTLVPSGGPLPVPSVLGRSYLPSSITFRTNATTTDSSKYKEWMVAYRILGMSDWNLIKADQAGYIAQSVPVTVAAYLQAWDPSLSKWVSGPETTQDLPIVVNVDAPVIKDLAGNILGTTWEREGLTIALDMQAKGTIYFTTNELEPDSNSSWTEKWTPGKILTFPATSEYLTIRAIAVVDGNKSQTTTLTVKRPTWANKDNRAAGCVESNGTQVFACGDATGPWYWSPGSGWTSIDPSWSGGEVKTLRVTDFDLFLATKTGEIWWAELASLGDGFSQLGSGLGTVGGLEFFNDTLWATTSSGPKYLDYETLTWETPPDIPSPAPYWSGAPGPAWQDGEQLWMGFSNQLWRHGPATASVSAAWLDWTYIGSSITWIGPDPFAPTGLAVGTTSGLQQIPSVPGGTASTQLYSGTPVIQAVGVKGAGFVATDNQGGSGGVGRIPGWTAMGISTNRGWPTSGNMGVSSQGIGRFSANGKDWMLATTLQGTYVIRILE